MDIKEQLKIIKRKTVEVIKEEELLDRLKTGKPLRVKLDIDASGPDIHLGFAVVLRKLREFQDLGHKAVLIVGDFTGKIGDPSGRSKTRPQLTDEEIKKNIKKYSYQIFKILNPDRTEFRCNSEWLDKLTAADIVNLSSKYTVARMLERDDFSIRYKKNKPIAIHELLYSLFQAYDSISIKADVELGGTDQTFNFVTARDIQREFGQQPQVVITMPLLEGLDGKLKMSKSYNNYIGISEPPKEIYGKIMSLPDNLIMRYYELTTDLGNGELKKIRNRLKSGENPRNLKASLAYRVVSMYHSEKEAKAAGEEFTRIFKKKGLPEEIPIHKVKAKKIWIVKLLTEAGLASSSSEARRLINQGGVTVDGGKLTDESYELEIKKEVIIKAGKRKFAKVIPS